MKQVEKMYDIIYSDARLQKLYYSFHSNNWDKYDIKQKKAIFEEINDIISSLYGYKKPTIVWSKKNRNLGSANSFNWQLLMNEEKLSKGVSYDNLDTYFHELRHFFQHRACENQLTEKEYVSEDNREKWKRNFLPGNYFSSDSEYYAYQPVERDAWSTAMIMVRRVYFMNQELCKTDKEKQQWELYCQTYKHVISQFISETDYNQRLLASVDEQIKSMYDEREKDNKEYQLGREIVKTFLNRENELKDATIYQAMVLFSPYCFVNLENKDKIKLVKVYAKYLGLEKMKIVQHNVDSIEIGKQAFPNDSALSLVNHLLSFKYLNIGNQIAKDKYLGDDISDIAKHEISLNLYEDEKGKKINFIKDMDNLFLFSLQPYAKYEAEYILNEFAKIKAIEKKIFNKNHNEWKFWDNFYDQEKIYKVASKLMDMPFDEYYKEQLEQYKKNIEASKKKNTDR